MGAFDFLLGNTGDIRRAAADTYGRQTAATGAIRDFGDQYASKFAALAKGYDPYVQAGGEAASQFTNLLRDPSSVRSLPGYEFMRGEGMRGVENSAAARSGILNGKTLKDVDRFNSNYADTSYGNQFQRLMGATGQGQAATGAQINTEGTGLQGQLGTRQSAYSGDMQAAQTLGQGEIAAANARNAAIGNLLNLGGSVVGSIAGGGMPFGSVTGGNGNIIAKLFGGGGSQDNPWMVGSSNRIPVAGTNF